MKQTHIYVLIDPTTNKIRYVGKANNLSKRFYAHISKSRSTVRANSHLYNWIRSLTSKGLKPIMEKIDIVEELEWEFWEQHYISLYKSWGFDLTNSTEGGYTASKETIEKCKEARRNKKKSILSHINCNSRKVLVTNMDTGEEVEYLGLTVVSKVLNLKRAKLQEVLSDKYPRKSYKRYQLRYA